MSPEEQDAYLIKLMDRMDDDSPCVDIPDFDTADEFVEWVHSLKPVKDGKEDAHEPDQRPEQF
jgi:hypothetical protein